METVVGLNRESLESAGGAVALNDCLDGNPHHMNWSQPECVLTKTRLKQDC